MAPRTETNESELALSPPAAPARQAYLLLRAAFIVLPLAAGLDKFAHVLVDWDKYLAPVAARLLPIGGHLFMRLAGAVEVAAGLLGAVRPRAGGMVVAVWLCGIAVNLLVFPGFYDIALRDFCLAAGALRSE